MLNLKLHIYLINFPKLKLKETLLYRNCSRSSPTFTRLIFIIAHFTGEDNQGANRLSNLFVGSLSYYGLT